jgi:hypothetical protein
MLLVGWVDILPGMRTLSTLLSLCATALLLVAPKNALAAAWIVVRLAAPDVQLTAPVTVVLVTEDGSQVTATLNDSGTGPDVFADDDSFTGSANVGSGKILVTLKSGDKTWDGGEVVWDKGSGPRDLVLRLTGDLLNAKPITGEPTSEDIAGGDTPPSATPGENTHTPGTKPEKPSAINDTVDNGVLLIGAGLLALALSGLWWLRASANAGADAIAGLELVAPPGLWGEGTPSIADGLSIWALPEGERASFLPDLVRKLAPHHRVLVVGEGDMNLPSVHGGPVYRSKVTGAVRIGDLAEDVLALSSQPLVLVLTDPPTSSDHLDEMRDMLPVDLCCLAVSNSVADGFPGVLVTRDADGWQFVATNSSL